MLSKRILNLILKKKTLKFVIEISMFLKLKTAVKLDN